MRNLNEDNITQAVLARLAQTPDPRLKEIMESLVRHLHAFAREVRLTEGEWFQGIDFLTRVGHITDDKRQ
ncbi:MAG TPA: dioxygenase, partial [Ramlibacter sp.]